MSVVANAACGMAATHYYETIVISSHGSLRARVVSLPAVPVPPQTLLFVQLIEEAGLEPLDRVEPSELIRALGAAAGPVQIDEEEWNEFRNELSERPVVPIERSPTVGSSLGALLTSLAEASSSEARLVQSLA
jgi:hypothetical protein